MIVSFSPLWELPHLTNGGLRLFVAGTPIGRFVLETQKVIDLAKLRGSPCLLSCHVLRLELLLFCRADVPWR